MKIEITKKWSATVLVDSQNGFTPVCPKELPVPDGNIIVGECLKTFKKTEWKIASKDAHSRSAEWITEFGTCVAKPIERDAALNPFRKWTFIGQDTVKWAQPDLN